MTQRLTPIWIAAGLSTLAIACAALFGSGLEDQWQLAARYTARASFPVFLIAYSASSLVRLWPGELTKTMLRHRRQWGLGFAFAHTVHLGALTYFYYAFMDRTPTAQTLIGGGGAYVVMYAMALTSNDASQRALGVWWKRLHQLGIHWLWFIFAFSYFGRLFEADSRMQGAIFFPLCVGALGLRVAAAIRTRRKVTA